MPFVGNHLFRRDPRLQTTHHHVKRDARNSHADGAGFIQAQWNRVGMNRGLLSSLYHEAGVLSEIFIVQGHSFRGQIAVRR